MDSIVESLGSMINADTIGSLSKAVGADSGTVSKALAAAGPLLLGGMTRMAGTSGGAETLLKMLPEESGGLLGSLGKLFTGGILGGASEGPGGGLLSSLLGPGTNAVSAWLSKTLGFNVAPLLAMAAPAIMGVVAKLVKSQNLDAGALAALLKREQTEFAANPANAEAVALASSAERAGDEAAAKIQAYGSEWSKVAAGPAAALFMVAAADPSSPIGAMKEASAAGSALLDAAKGAAPSSLLGTAFGSGMTLDMLRDLKSVAPTKDKLLQAIEGAAAAVAVKSPGEVQSYHHTILAVAKAAAEASKEGGFLGIGGTLVSKEEQSALDAIEAALSRGESASGKRPLAS
jgi:uncharacterized protein DUF937